MTSLRTILLVWGLLPLTGILSAADPQLLNLMMPDARAVAGVNVEQARISPLGQFVLARIARQDQHLQKFMNATGFDPRRDITEVMIASTAQPGEHKGLLLVKGRFDVEKILAAAREHGQGVQTYQGINLFGDKDKNGLMALLDSSTVVAGDAENVRAAIDRRNSTANALAPEVAVKIAELSGSLDAWGLSLVPLSEMRSGVPDQQVRGLMAGDMFKKIDQGSAGLKFGELIQVAAELVAQTEKDAAALADVVRFLGNLVQLNAPQNSPGSLLSTLLKSLDVKSDANTVKVTASLPEHDLEAVLEAGAPFAAGKSSRVRRGGSVHVE
jgi:hypothetical protein